MPINEDYCKLPLAGGSNSLAFYSAAFAAALRSCSAIIPSSDRCTTSLAAIVDESLRAAASTAFNSSLTVAPCRIVFLVILKIVTSFILITIVLFIRILVGFSEGR